MYETPAIQACRTKQPPYLHEVCVCLSVVELYGPDSTEIVQVLGHLIIASVLGKCRL